MKFLLNLPLRACLVCAQRESRASLEVVRGEVQGLVYEWGIQAGGALVTAQSRSKIRCAHRICACCAEDACARTVGIPFTLRRRSLILSGFSELRDS